MTIYKFITFGIRHNCCCCQQRKSPHIAKP